MASAKDGKVRRTAWLSALTSLTLSATGCHNPGTRVRGEATEGGWVLLLPGISNTKVELAGFSRMLSDESPDRRVEVRPWGPTMLLFSNLSEYEHNLKTAMAIAEEIATYRREYPDRPVDLLGYSGGGAMACFVVASLPKEVQVDRLVLMAPAISRQYPIETAVLPKVKDFAVVFMSPLDPLVGTGTRVFGTMDRRNSPSAGSIGFPIEDDKLVQIQWDSKMIGDGHFGGHLDYLSPAWQRKYLLPAFDHTASQTRIPQPLADIGALGNDPRAEAAPPRGGAILAAPAK